MIDYIRQGYVKRFYNCKEWRRKRREILNQDNGECQKCKGRGSFANAECVHHIKHIKDRPELALSDDNLISLCAICHNEEHPEKLKRFNKANKFINMERW